MRLGPFIISLNSRGRRQDRFGVRIKYLLWSDGRLPGLFIGGYKRLAILWRP